MEKTFFLKQKLCKNKQKKKNLNKHATHLSKRTLANCFQQRKVIKRDFALRLAVKQLASRALLCHTHSTTMFDWWHTHTYFDAFDGVVDARDPRRSLVLSRANKKTRVRFDFILVCVFVVLREKYISDCFLIHCCWISKDSHNVWIESDNNKSKNNPNFFNFLHYRLRLNNKCDEVFSIQNKIFSLYKNKQENQIIHLFLDLLNGNKKKKNGFQKKKKKFQFLGFFLIFFLPLWVLSSTTFRIKQFKTTTNTSMTT